MHKNSSSQFGLAYALKKIIKNNGISIAWLPNVYAFLTTQTFTRKGLNSLLKKHCYFFHTNVLIH